METDAVAVAVEELPASVESVLRTFLTADVRGYTRFTQEFGDEAAARLAIKFAAVAREGVGAYGGEVVELRGDEALCVFASARQALRAAVDLQKRFLSETESDPDLPLRVGIGLDAGEVIPVEAGYRGGALNLAARLSSLAGPGEVLASDAAVHLARKIKGLTYIERGHADLKGFAEPVPVIRILDETDYVRAAAVAENAMKVKKAQAKASDGANGNGMLAPPDLGSMEPLPIGGFLGALPEGLLVARDEEFDRILAAIQAVEGGSGRLVLLSGEPGVGKTRLAQEVTLKARNHGFVMASGRCYEPESSVPYYPFLEALATLFNVASPSIREAAASRWPDVMRLLPNQGSSHILGISGGQEEQQRLFWGVTGFLQAVAADRPVALLLDDLHWADGSSLDLLQHLTRHTRTSRILLLGTYRDVDVNRQHPLEAALRDLGRERLVEDIEIRRLQPRGTAELMSTTLGGREVHEDLVRLVHGQTEGNPFFVEEVVRNLAERGDVYLNKSGCWEGLSVEDVEVPRSVRSVVGQRLSRLEPDSQEVLREASVLGPTFHFEDLLHMCERSESEVEAALEDALTARIVRETGADTYSFNHALTQGTLYAELPSRRRRRLHQAAGKAIEQLAESARQSRTAELAWHFLEADDPERALPYALDAAKMARDLFAYDEAERHFRTALELARDIGAKKEEAWALEGLGLILRIVARYEESLQAYDAALALHRASHNVAGIRWTTANIGRVHALRGTARQGIDQIRALLSIIETSGSDETEGATRSGLAALYTALANLYQSTEQKGQMLEAAEKALELARDAGDSKVGARIQAEGQMWRAAALAELGDLEDARRMLEDVVPQAEQTGDGLVLSRTLNSLASVYSEAGQYDKERAYIEKALAAAERLGDPSRVAYMQQRLGWHLLVRGIWDEASTQLENGTETWRSLGFPPASNWSILALGHLAILRGETEKGDELMAQADDLNNRPAQEQHYRALSEWMRLDRLMREGRFEEAAARAAEIPEEITAADWLKAFLLPLKAWIELEVGDVRRAEDLANEATEMATAERNRTILVEALRVQGMILAREGGYEDAEHAFHESISTARTIEQPYAEARSIESFGLSKVAGGDEAQAVSLLSEALEIYERLGAVAEAERIAGRISLLKVEEREPVPAG